MQKKPPFINIVIAALLALLTVLIGLLSGFAPNEVPEAIAPYLRFTWPLLGIVTLAFIGLTIWLTVRQLASDDDRLVSRSEHRQQLLEKQNRQRMLAKVHSIWIKGVLEQSLHGAALIALGLQDQPDAVENPWRLVLQQPHQSSQQLPPGTRITPVYDDSGGELLILGEPGCGKTTLLLELTRDLLNRARLESTHPMPVVFNLTSWAVKRQPLTNWLIEELNLKYQVPRKLGKMWIESDQVLPLLDGLDEVTQAARAACVEAINRYRQEHGVPTVVCSRSTDYLAQTTRLQLYRAVVVQPPTTQQINEYLESAGPQLAKLRVARLKDPVLQELTATPLMLNVLTLAYHDIPFEDLLATSTLERRTRQVFATYIQQMLQRRSVNPRYTPQQTICRLAWLAKQLKLHNQTEFYIELMQPNWTSKTKLYEVIAGLISGIFCGSIFGLIMGLAAFFLINQGAGLFYGIEGISFFALLTGLCAGLKREIDLAEVLVWSFEYVRQKLAVVIAIGLLGAAIPAIFSPIILALHTLSPLTIKESMLWVFGGLLIGLLMGLLGILSIELVTGLSSKTLETQKRLKPNQGIRSSTFNGLRAGLLAFFCILLPAGLLEELIGGQSQGLFVALFMGLIAIWIAGLFSYGGVAGFQHIALRLTLWRAGSIPLHYIRFLNYAADCILLRKVGGGYIFVHRLLLEYFALLDTTSNSAS